MFVGDGGTGKTSFVNNLMKRHLSVSRIGITQTLTSIQLQANILDRLAQQLKQHGQRMVLPKRSTTLATGLYLDDLHLAHLDDQTSLNVSSPLLETIRYLLYHRKIADPLRRWYENNLNFKYLASCTPEGYWRLPIRLVKSMCLLPFLPPSDKCLHQVFSQSLQLWLTSFSSSSVLWNAKQIANVRQSIIIIV